MINTIKRLINGTTTYYKILKGSGELNGISFTPILSKKVECRTIIHSVEFKCNDKIIHSWRITVDGEKIFPFTEFARIHSEKLMPIMPVSIKKGSYFQIEVVSSDKDDRDIIILTELDIVEER